MLSARDARNLATQFGFPLSVDFHSLCAAQVAAVISAADFRGYRKPRNANGSRARYFHAYLVRRANSED